jgi:hypothetical protein
VIAETGHIQEDPPHALVPRHRQRADPAAKASAGVVEFADQRGE